MTQPLMVATDLTKIYRLKSGLFSKRASHAAVSSVNLDLAPRDRVGLVGESGSGKSTIGRLLLGLTSPTSGTVRFEGVSHDLRRGSDWQVFRRDTSLVQQNPHAALNPQIRIGLQIAEPVLVHRLGSPTAAQDQAAAMLERVGMPSAMMNRFPHQLSGGQRQRVIMARALILKPKLVVFDEAVSALDVSVQAQVIAQIRVLWEELGLAYIFITHDLRLVRYVVDRIAVLYLGQIVEIGDVRSVYAAPRHPYTRALLASVPSMDPKQRHIPPPILGERPVGGLQQGCAFRTRCPNATSRCNSEAPALRHLGYVQVACHHAEELAPSSRVLMEAAT